MMVRVFTTLPFPVRITTVARMSRFRGKQAKLFNTVMLCASLGQRSILQIAKGVGRRVAIEDNVSKAR